MTVAQAIDPVSQRKPISTPVGTVVGKRLDGIDRMRGLVIVIMALDHVRDFVHHDSVFMDPSDPDRTNLALFLTRFVTHYCAPTFVLLAGLAAALLGERLRDRKRLAEFLLTRGLWLMFLELTVVSFAWSFGSGHLIGVIWAIGLSMVLLSAASLLPPVGVLSLGCAIVLGHNLLDGVHSADFGSYGWLWMIVHEPGVIARPFTIAVGYPVLPWFGLMCVGFGLASHYRLEAARRARLFTFYGVMMLALFIVVRTLNGYGDPSPWTGRGELERTAFDFFRVTKYPPSLDYLLVTLGPIFLLLPRMENLKGWIGSTLAIYGRVPLFFYVLHLYLGHLIGYLTPLLEGYRPVPPDFVGGMFLPQNEVWRFNLPTTYLVWILLVASLYFPCRWFAGVKARRRDWWLSYL
jgi:uncharacterized membrane protein